jgi:proteasome lid subunit RPN8/RPN11
MNNFPERPEENMFRQRRLPSSDSVDQIIWTERKDVYRPISLSIDDFTSRRGIPSSSYKEVFFSKEALETLTRHLDTDPRIEQGGILFGNAYEDSRFGIYVEITAAVPAPQTIGTVAHLEFTPDSWLSIMNYARAQHPTENLVGWYHSHPNHGVFMSSVDMRTQTAFFSHPWCLSVVCDPIRRNIGYFLGKTARPVKPVQFSLFGKPPSQPPESVPSPHDSDSLETRLSEPSARDVDSTEENDDSRPASENSIASTAILVLKSFLKWLANLSPVIVLCLMVWNAFLLGLNQYFLQLLADNTGFHFNSLMSLMISYNFRTILLNIFAFVLLIFTAFKTQGKNLKANRSQQVRR